MVIVSVILFGSYASLPGNQAFGWPQSILYKLSVLIQVLHSVLACRYVRKHKYHTHKHKYVQIILVLLHQRFCALMVSQIVYISWNTWQCINNKYILSLMLDVLTSMFVHIVTS